MGLFDLGTADFIGAVLGFILTLLVFSYLLGDNPLFRITIHVFIGVATGFAAVLAWYSVIWPQLIAPLAFGGQSDRLLLLFPLLLTVLIMLKVSRRTAAWGNLALAYLVGVGAAAAIGGAVLGTLFPQALATINLMDRQALAAAPGPAGRVLESGLVLVGTLTTLAYFHFGARQRPGGPPARPPWMRWIAGTGQVFIAIAFGALFSGVITAAVAALVERMSFLVAFIQSLLSL